MEIADSIYSPSRVVTDLKDCHFYHTMGLPGYGLIQGEWDLRDHVDQYLGYVPLKGKRVLEVGTASGYLCFEMEKRGADVVAYDLSENDSWDVVPYGGVVTDEQTQDRKKTIRGTNNAWWLSHRVFESRAQAVYGPVYAIPKAIGPVDVATFGSILLHLRDPFLALQKAAELTTETMIVTDLMSLVPRRIYSPFRLLPRFVRRYTVDRILYAPLFMPKPEKKFPWDGWWGLTPELVERFLKILGFTNTTITYHRQKYNYKPRPVNLFTVVGKREGKDNGGLLPP